MSDHSRTLEPPLLDNHKISLRGQVAATVWDQSWTRVGKGRVEGEARSDMILLLCFLSETMVVGVVGGWGNNGHVCLVQRAFLCPS